MAERKRRFERVIWSALHTGGMNEKHFHTVIERAAAEGVSGVELSGRGIGRYITYRSFPELAGDVQTAEVETHQAVLRRLTEHAAEKKLRFGLWHHEIDGPKGLLDRMPALRGADGLINLDSPALYRFITENLREFFDRFPLVNELVLTMTETDFPVFRRPFCAIPIAERVRRLLRAVLDATEPLGKQLVIRPFSAVREDEIHVREAVGQLKATHLSMMYKTEPFDWHAFLMNEPLIGSVPQYEARAETDAGAEYYGQAVFPCSYTQHLEYRLASAAEKGATVAVIRVDRGAHHSGLGHVINEANVIPPTRWALDAARSMPDCWREWCRERHGYESPQLYALLERTFDVIKKTLYIDQQMFSHHLFPDLRGAKHVQAFALFEEGVPLDHLRLNWGMIATRRSLTHRQVLAEKQEGLDLARAILAEFEKLSAGMPPASRQAMAESLRNLPILSEACLAFCRVCIAHLEEMWRATDRTTDSFDAEAQRMMALAERIDSEKGPRFWLGMTDSMRGIVSGLQTERKMEAPLRKALDTRPGVADYVLCGFASEGHRLEKMLHSGQTFVIGDRFVRATGLGPEQSIGYTLRRQRGRAHRLIVTLAGEGGYDAPGRIRIDGQEHIMDAGPISGLKELVFDVPATDSTELKITLWCTTPRRLQVAELLLAAV